MNKEYEIKTFDNYTLIEVLAEKLDIIMTPNFKSELVIIAGRPAQGKTSLGLSILKNASLMGKKVGICKKSQKT